MLFEFSSIQSLGRGRLVVVHVVVHGATWYNVVVVDWDVVHGATWYNAVVVDWSLSLSGRGRLVVVVDWAWSTGRCPRVNCI